jgi:3-hydroxyisobutyrate dehydrogenase-like beta-hydroxyacid dehydrogenase
VTREGSPPSPALGIIGLGEMGGPIAARLVRAGYPTTGFDLRAEALAALVAAGGDAAANGAAVVAAAEAVLLSLPSAEAFVAVAETELLPHARPGQVFIELGTSVPDDIRRLAAAFAERGAALLDVPLSGGRAGAEQGRLRLFAGGDRATFDRWRHLLETIGGRDTIYYCGPAGMGSVLKGVNQLKMGLHAALHLEILAFAVREGLDLAVVERAFPTEGWLSLHDFPARLARGEGPNIGVKFRELPYYLRQAHAHGYELPLTRALHAFCDRGERLVIDDHRPAPSFWHELMRPAR